MENTKKFWTLRYTLINITYFMCFCTLHQFASVYLLDRGFTNTQIGILLAFANIMSAICQPYIAGLIDRPGKFTNRNVIMGSSALIMLGSILLIFLSDIKAIVFVIFALIYMIQFLYQPVLTALMFEYQKSGCNIFYGLARGLGSAGFAATSAFIGTAVEKNGTIVLLVGNIVTMIALITLTFFFKKPDGVATVTSDNNASSEGASNNKELVAHNNIKEFASLYPIFILLLVGTVLLFFGHNTLNDYLIQIITNAGGSESDLGYATSLAAFLELPAMATITIIVKKISPNKLLILSAIFFTLKVVVMLLAQNMFMVYVSQTFQLLAYAVFIPSSAYYVSANMEELDQVKGQAYVTACITLSGVFSSLVGGRVLDSLGVHTMLLISVVVSLIGTIVTIIAMLKKNSKAINA